MPAKASGPLLQELSKRLESEGQELAQKVKGLIVFKIDGDIWSLDLREGSNGSLSNAEPAGDDTADLTLTISDENFVKLVMGKLNPQQAFILRKLKLSGSMGLAMKLQPILDAAKPQSKL